jgi:large subunit ribosomal protein L15
MPLQRRVPKFGFTNINRKEYEGVNLDTLQLLVDNGVITDTVDMTTLLQIVWLLKMKSLRF